VVFSAVVLPLTLGRFELVRSVWSAGGFLVLQGLLHYVLGRVED
jgi:hypothetical protein